MSFGHRHGAGHTRAHAHVGGGHVHGDGRETGDPNDRHAGPASPELRQRQFRALRFALVANGLFLVVEVVGGVVFGSLALLADAAHMLSDVAGLAIAMVAHVLSGRPASARHTYGLARAEVLGAQANGVLLVAGSGWILFEALRRMGDDHPVDGAGLLVVAFLGLLVNAVSAWRLAQAGGSNLNVRAALVHLAADAAGSVAAMIAGLAVLVADARWVDPAASVLIALLVLHSAWGLLRDATRVLLEATPAGLDRDAVMATLAAQPGVTAVHHLHLWSLASDVPAASVHVVLDGEPSLHEAQRRGDELRALLAERFGVDHATVELECHPCQPEVS